MKRIAKLLIALLMSVVVTGVASAATGVNPYVVFGALQLGAAAMPQGVAGMALNQEVWKSSIVEGLFADNSFLSKAVNSSEFVNFKTVHIPNAGSASSVTKDRSTFPATIGTRTDVDLTFSLSEFTTDPVRVPHAETVELSYNKRESIMKQDKSALANAVAEDVLYNWMPLSANCISTTGDAVAAHTPSATGNRKAFTKDDLKTAMSTFNAANVPQEGRYALIDAQMYDQLIDSMTDKDALAFHAQADVANGVVGKIYSFNVMMRSRVSVYATGGTIKKWSTTGATTDNAAALCWHEASLTAALGDTEMFEQEKDPTYYSDIFSFLVRAGGNKLRNDNVGILAIRQAASE